MLVVFAIISGLLLINTVINWWTQVPNQLNTLAELGSAIGSFFHKGYDLFVIGGLKYVVLILAEVVIFHFARRTLEVITGEDVDNSFQAFLGAQKRMMGIAVYSFIMESIYSVLF